MKKEHTMPDVWIPVHPGLGPQLPSQRMTDDRMQMLALLGGFLCFLGGLSDLPTFLCPATSSALFCGDSAMAVAHFSSVFLAGLGSALIGAGLTQLASNKKSRDLLAEVSDALSRTVAQPAVYSTESSIEHLRRTFWVYHATQRNRITVWRVATIDFQKLPSINRLSALLQNVHTDGRPDMIYEVDAFVRDNSLILLQHPQSKVEPTSVRVFPSGGTETDSYSGLYFHLNFDDKPAVNCTILSRFPLLDLAKPGLIEDEKTILELNNLWSAGFRTSDIVIGTGVHVLRR